MFLAQLKLCVFMWYFPIIKNESSVLHTAVSVYCKSCFVQNRLYNVSQFHQNSAKEIRILSVRVPKFYLG